MRRVAKLWKAVQAIKVMLNLRKTHGLPSPCIILLESEFKSCLLDLALTTFLHSPCEVPRGLTVFKNNFNNVSPVNCLFIFLLFEEINRKKSLQTVQSILSTNLIYLDQFENFRIYLNIPRFAFPSIFQCSPNQVSSENTTERILYPGLTANPTQPLRVGRQLPTLHGIPTI